MRIAAFQYPVSADLSKNRQNILEGMRQAAEQGARLLLLPECSLTGYPGEDFESTDKIDFDAAKAALSEVDASSTALGLWVVFGMVERQNGHCYNSAMLAAPNEPVRTLYRKRALWGWDADHFQTGDCADGIFNLEGFRFGVRICFEVRFPEYFRELYRQNTDCNLVLFSDRSEQDSPERYELITAHLRTRAVENITPTISVNTCSKYQTAPTAVFDEDGVILAEQPRHETGLLLYDLVRKQELSFGAQGRKQLSDRLTKHA
jgi:predicted amidohydrolase